MKSIEFKNILLLVYLKESNGAVLSVNRDITYAVIHLLASAMQDFTLRNISVVIFCGREILQKKKKKIARGKGKNIASCNTSSSGFSKPQEHTDEIGHPKTNP